MSTAPGWTSATGRAFSSEWDAVRRCWVIRRHGRVYQVVLTGRKYPGHTESYVRRIIDILNQETS